MTEMTFVVSDDASVNGFGIGKLVDSEQAGALIQYFVSPAEDPIERAVAPDSIREVELQPQERIFYIEDSTWRVGRLQGYLGPDDLALRLPNQQVAKVCVQDAHVRSNLQIESPLGLLQTRNTETAFWHEGRAALVRSLATQRAAYRGLTGLASSNVEIFRHQLAVAHRVLNDPIPRYLLADEVGLGKTIEVGIIVRQHLLDDPVNSKVLIVVPEHLVPQWQTELERLFHALHVTVVADNDKRLLVELASRITLLVVDEAHRLAQYAYDEGEGGAYYRAISRLAQESRGVLLLSATPVVHNEDAFLGMLHLLDPAAHSLDDREGFRERIRHREVIAGAVRDLEDDASSFFIEPALQDIRPLAAANPRLAALIEAVEEIVDEPNDPKRPEVIAALRTHLQETYRLDRRLLRTRRAQNGVCEDLPKREHEAWPQQDQQRIDMFEWLDQWRFSAADTADARHCAATMFGFLEAAFSHPTLLTRSIDARGAALKDGAAPYFDGEAAFLLRAPESVSVGEDPRIEMLEVVLRDTASKHQKWVVFVSDAKVADQVSAILSRSFNVLRLESGEAANESVAEFRDDKEIRAIVCDEKSEDGLNLQGVGAKIVHFDLPLAANRIEQRIGRLDRLRGDPNVLSLVPVLQTPTGSTNYEGAWAECLIGVVQVFDRSVASLQHALDTGRRRLLDSLVDGGVEAIADLSAGWQSDDGDLSLGRELRRIESQDLLDELETLEGEHNDLYEELEEYEYDPSLATQFLKEVSDWASRSLGFNRHVDTNGAVEFEQTRRTLMANSRFADAFAQSFHLERRRRGPCTGWMHFSRNRAEKLNFPVVRVGHPFINDLQQFMAADERGRAFAFWREIPDYANEYETGNFADLFFRFDFLIEANMAAARDLIESRGLAAGVVARRAEEAFTPQYHTIWVDLDNVQVTDRDLIADLERPRDTTTDTSLRGSRWQTVDDLGMVADWPRVCQSAYATASTLLGEAIGLDERIASAQRQLAFRYKAAEQQLESRIAVLEHRSGDVEALAMERELHECMEKVVSEPRVRLDSVGVAFLSGQRLREQVVDG